MNEWWARHAARAAAARLAEGRGLDAEWVAQFEREVVETTRQTGGDVVAALDDLHVGLYAAVSGPVAAQGGPWRPRGTGRATGPLRAVPGPRGRPS